MSVEKIQRDITNLFNYPSDPNPTTQADYITAVKNWVGNVINLVDISLWQPETAYAVGAIVRTPSLPVFALKCITAGTSDVTEPDYTDVSEGDTVQDNNIEWMICTISTTFEVGKANIDASNIGVNAEEDNSDLWGSAIGGGEIAEDDGKLVTGGTVYAVTNGLASDIADNTDDIATNTANISQNATDIGIADKRITNIEKLLQGNLYDYQTDTDSAYTKSVPSGAMPYAGIEQIGGKTVVMNQLVGDPNMTDASKWSNRINPSEFSFSVNNNTLTVTKNSSTNIQVYCKSHTISPTVGHKYYVSAEVSSDVTDPFNSRFFVGSVGNSFEVTNTSVRHSDIITCSEKTVDTMIFQAGASSVPDGKSIFIKNFICVDLTLMFGSGNEPSTVEEFQQMFPAEWYEYNAGTLLSAGVTEVVSKGANTTTIATYSIPTAIRNLEGYGWSAGTAYNYVDFERKKFVKCVDRVDMGTLSWGASAGMWRTTGIYSVLKIDSTAPNLLNAKYPAVAWSNRGEGKMVIDNSGAVYVTDSTYSDATAFETAMSGVYLYYELATPVETDISEYLTDDNLIQVESGGTLTFPNSNGDDYRLPVPSEEEYMIDLQEAINNG